MPTKKPNNQSFASRIEPKLSISVIILVVLVWTVAMTYAMSFIKTDGTAVAEDVEIVEFNGNEPDNTTYDETTTEGVN